MITISLHYVHQNTLRIWIEWLSMYSYYYEMVYMYVSKCDPQPLVLSVFTLV